MNTPVKRLINYFVPKSYDLHITQDSESLLFSGKVTIDGVLKKNELILHSSDLNIISVNVNGNKCSYKTDEKAQELTIATNGLEPGETTVEIAFDGIITKQMHGLYPCFFEHGAKEKRLLATQFESHHAREVFPCVDEPEAKAVFTLHLTTDADDVVVSNTPVADESRTKNSKLKTISFEPTPIMSTYLLAWVSGELIYEEAFSDHGIQVRTYATPVHKGKLTYAVEVACKSMDFMDDYFDIEYPLKKFDQVALPDFASGAMENWGCVTFRESALLYDPKLSDLSDKQHVAEVVTHEMSHQWFGNLVTMRWWEDLWLNEGFASWIPYMILDELHPEWKVWERFATGDLMIGLRADSLENTHPIVVKINSPGEIGSAFDSISYDKGCCAINLLYNYIGKNAFRDGLRQYLKTHAYANAETKDLWAAWSKSSGKDVATFMSSWTEKPGFPIVTVKSDEIGMHLSQQRFFTNPTHGADSTIWPIPLMRTDDDVEMLSTNSSTVAGSSKLNRGQSGFYRAVYSGPLKDAFIKDITNQKMNPIDALGLITDAAEAARAGFHSTTEVFDLSIRAKDYINEPLVSTILGEFAECRNILSDTFEAMKPTVLDFITPNLERLGTQRVKNESVGDELLRPSVLSAASYAGNSAVVGWALEQFSAAALPEDMRSDIRPTIYHTAVRELGDQKSYDKLLAWYKRTTIPGEKTSLAAALMGFKDQAIFKNSLAMITGKDVRLQDSLYWVAYSLSNRHNKYLAWDWVKTHWDWVIENFGREKELDYYLRFCARGFATKEHLKDYTDFFGRVNISGSKRAYEQGKETITWQSAWRSRDTQPMLNWLKHFTD